MQKKGYDVGESATGRHRKEDRVRARILLPFAVVVLSVIGAFILATYVYQDWEHARQLNENVAAAQHLFHQGVEKDVAMLQAALIGISSNKEIRSAFLARDRQALLSLTGPLFDRLRKNNRITHFYFDDPDQINFLRVHEPGEFGDRIDRVSTRRALQGRNFVSGIELGVLGTLTLRVVMPWYVGNRLIGLLELGEEVGHIADAVHEILGVDLLVLVSNQLIDAQRWEEGRSMLRHENDWLQLGAQFVVGRAMEKIPRSLVELLRRGGAAPHTVVRLQEDGRDLNVAILPLEDVSDQAVGRLVIVHDVTASQADFRTVMTSTALLSLLLGGGVFAVFYAILGRVERDYQRQREMELQLSRVNTEHQKAVQLEKLSAMGMMVGEIAHQLNNPLVGVINMAQLAEREIHDPKRSGEILEEIARAGKECKAFVSRMLEFTKISHFERSLTDMNQLVENTLSLFRQSVGEQIRIEVDLPAQSPVLNIDPILISHALFNLLSNAAEVSPSGKPISIRLFPEAREKGSLPGWSVSVRDHGPGLSDEALAKIYDPFYTTRSEGTGLGLTVVQHVAILHEGEISACNAEQSGAIFALWLPETQQEAE